MNTYDGSASGGGGPLGKDYEASQLGCQTITSFRVSCADGKPLPPGERPASFAVDELELRHLQTRSEIETILHLREAIDLSAHSGAGSQFLAREKKATSVALSGRLSCIERSSAPSGLCRWIGA